MPMYGTSYTPSLSCATALANAHGAHSRTRLLSVNTAAPIAYTGTGHAARALPPSPPSSSSCPLTFPAISPQHTTPQPCDQHHRGSIGVKNPYATKTPQHESPPCQQHSKSMSASAHDPRGAFQPRGSFQTAFEMCGAPESGLREVQRQREVKLHEPPMAYLGLEVTDINLSSPLDPVYRLRVSLNGRTYTAARSHRRMQCLFDMLRERQGCVIMRPLPPPEEMTSVCAGVRVCADKGEVGLGVEGEWGQRMGQRGAICVYDALDAWPLPVYEVFGYSIKSLAMNVMRPRGAQPRLEDKHAQPPRDWMKRHAASVMAQRCEQATLMLREYLHEIMEANEQQRPAIEQKVSQFFWEPLSFDKLPTVSEGEEEELDDQ